MGSFAGGAHFCHDYQGGLLALAQTSKRDLELPRLGEESYSLSLLKKKIKCCQLGDESLETKSMCLGGEFVAGLVLELGVTIQCTHGKEVEEWAGDRFLKLNPSCYC